MSSRDRPKGMTKDSVSLLPCFYFVELPILVSSAVSLYFLELTDLFTPVSSGYSCRDRSLSLPYVEPTHEVIPRLMMLSLAFAGPAITIMIGEGIVFCCHSWRKGGVGAEPDINAAGCNFNSFIRRVVRFVGVHVFGLCATAVLTDIIQLATGYHAPYFLTVCKPNYTTLNVTCDHNSYILDDICSGADPVLISRGRKSFPSQHATLASFAAVYVSMYVNSTLTESSKLLKPVLVLSFIMCAIICGLTRIIQYRNHPIDVYLGFLLGGALAVYLALFAVGNFQPSEETPSPPSPRPARPPCTLPHISQEAGRHLQAKSCGGVGGDGGLPGSHSAGALHRDLHHRGNGHNNNGPPGAPRKPAGGDAELMSPRGPAGRESLVTFSHTLPRAHVHAAADASRSQQLLTQWKSRNESRRFAAQTPPPPDSSCSSSETGAPAPHASHPYHHHGGDPDQRRPPHPCLAPGSSTTLPSNCGGGAGGGRVSLQARPGSSQLVHIPEESHDGHASPRAAGGGEGGAADGDWPKAAEKSGAPCRTNGGGQQQPRIMQVIAMSKQQGLLHSRSLDDPGGRGQGRYRALTDQDGPGPPLGALGAAGGISGSTGAIVRVEAHPENGRPPGDGGASWMWRPQVGGGGGAELNDLNRDSESSEFAGDATPDRKSAAARNPHGANGADAAQRPDDPGLHAQPVTTIRVTPGEGGGGGDALSDTPASVASSRDSTLRRKGTNVILIPERGNSPETTRNIFYRGTSSTPAFRD